MYKIINRNKLYATMAADMLGYVVSAPWRIFRRKARIDPSRIREILVIRTAYIGDAVMTIPVLKPLKDYFNDCRITFLTSKGGGEVLRNNPYLDDIATYDPFWFYNKAGFPEYREFIGEFKKRPFDLVIEARADIREILMLVRPLKAGVKLSYKVGGGGYMLTHAVPYPGLKHKVQYHLDLVRYLGCNADEVTWGVYLTDEEKVGADALLKGKGIDGRFVAVHPGTRLELKRWTPEGYAIVYDWIIENYGVPLVVMGTKDEEAFAGEVMGRMKNRPVSLVGQTSLRQVAGVLRRAELFVCNDSAPMHMAASLGTPTVAIFGPSKSVETGPYGEGHRVVEKDFPCRFVCDENTCLYKDYNACMKTINPDDVISAVKELLG